MIEAKYERPLAYPAPVPYTPSPVPTYPPGQTW